MFPRIANTIQRLRTLLADLKHWAPVYCTAFVLVLVSPVFAETKPAGLGEKSFSVRIEGRQDDQGAKLAVTEGEIQQAILVVEKRLELLGFNDITFSKPEEEGFNFSLKGVRSTQGPGIVRALQKVGRFSLNEVSPRNDESGPDGKSLAERVQGGSELVPGYRALSLVMTDEDGKKFSKPILVNRRSVLGGSDIESAVPYIQQKDAVSITLNPEGAKKMIAFTKNLRPGHDRIAVVIDGKVIIAPVVNQVPLGKQFIIEGLREPGEPADLANSLKNPLEHPLIIEELHPDPAEKDAK